MSNVHFLILPVIHFIAAISDFDNISAWKYELWKLFLSFQM